MKVFNDIKTKVWSKYITLHRQQNVLPGSTPKKSF